LLFYLREEERGFGTQLRLLSVSLLLSSVIENLMQRLSLRKNLESSGRVRELLRDDPWI
jgi:hypothetical protein